MKYVTILCFLTCSVVGYAYEEAYLTGVPSYVWKYGCYGTASGTILGYWDRHGMSNFYTGMVNGGVAPLDMNGANGEVYSMWASHAGHDGRSATNWGHVDDYYDVYESTNDPYLAAGRLEHTPDCAGDFMGLSQWRYTNMNGECNGNINAFAYNYWDLSGAPRFNFTPTNEAGETIRDVQSGLRAYANFCGYSADTMSQESEHWPLATHSGGMTFSDYKAEIDAGFPVIIQLQENSFTNSLGANPSIHAVVGFGYTIEDNGDEYVRYYKGYGGTWNENLWSDIDEILPPLSFRGVITFHPRPTITGMTRSGSVHRVTWVGPQPVLSHDGGLTNPLTFAIQICTNLQQGTFVEVASGGTNQWAEFTNSAPVLLMRLDRNP